MRFGSEKAPRKRRYFVCVVYYAYSGTELLSRYSMERDESWSGMAFTQATFINSVEVLPFFDELGFEKLSLLGQEGLTGPRLTKIENSDEEVRKTYLEISLRVCENPQYYAYSDHLLYVGKRKDE